MPKIGTPFENGKMCDILEFSSIRVSGVQDPPALSRRIFFIERKLPFASLVVK
jgi:hypothetical protein